MVMYITESRVSLYSKGIHEYPPINSSYMVFIFCCSSNFLCIALNIFLAIVEMSLKQQSGRNPMLLKAILLLNSKRPKLIITRKYKGNKKLIKWYITKNLNVIF